MTNEPVIVRLGCAIVVVLMLFLRGSVLAEPLVRETSAADVPPAVLEQQSDTDTLQPLAFKPVAVRALTASDLPPASVFARGSSGPGSVAVRWQGQWRPNGDVYRAIVERESQAFGLPPALLDAVMAVESRYNPSAVGADGEVGLMQVMPATARMLGFTGGAAQLAVPEVNIHYGAKYLAGAWRLADHDLCTAAMKYRAGHGETRFSFRSVDYCERVRSHLAARGVPVSGTVPQPSFGARTEARGRNRPPVGGGRVDLSAINARIRALADRNVPLASR
jgi:soluble lytic murein transglycosylase-like protein